MDGIWTFKKIDNQTLPFGIRKRYICTKIKKEKKDLYSFLRIRLTSLNKIFSHNGKNYESNKVTQTDNLKTDLKNEY